MKKSLLSMLFAVLICSCTSGPREFKNTQSYADNTCDWHKELRVTHVEFTDTATILTFFYQARQPWFTLCIAPEAYLSDERDRHYKALFMVEHPLGEFFGSGPDGTYFHVGFEPMPAGTKIFDMIEGTGSNYFKILGIHDSTYVPSKPKYSRKELKEAKQIRSNVFKSGPVTLRGTIVDYDINDGFQTYQMHFTFYDRDDHGTVALDIDRDGHFEYSFDTDNILGACIVDHTGSWHNIIVQPGDTLDITYYKDGSVSNMLSDGRPYLLSNYDRIPTSVYPVDHFKFQLGDSIDLMGVQAYSFECKAKGKDYVNYIAKKYHLTAFEYEYATIMMENDILEGFLNYRMDVKDDWISYYTKTENPDYRVIAEKQVRADSILVDPDGYAFLADFTANDSLMMVLPHQWVIFNRYKYDGAFCASEPRLDSLREQMAYPFFYALESYINDSVHLANDMKLYGASEPSLFGKLCMMEDIDYHLKVINDGLKDSTDSFREEYLLSYFAKTKSLLNDPVLEARADKIYQEFLRKQAPYWEIPECRGKEVLNGILANYPGKYVYIDFWSTGCGPCVSGIKSCFNYRRELMTGKFDNFALVFITSDPEQAYEPFRKEWLEGAESYRISQDDYNSLAGLFNFSAIPHHELITPDGLAVTDVMEMLGINPNNPEGK